MSFFIQFAWLRDNWQVPAIILGYGVLFLFFPISPHKQLFRELEERLELLENPTEERRAEKLFKLHQLELKRYYDQTLFQSQWIFIVGVFCLLIGFATIGVTYYLVINEHFAASTKRILGVLGGVASLLSNFVAVVYVKMYTEAIKSLTTFHNRLVETHHMHYGALLAAKIKNDDLLDKTLSHMAMGTVRERKDRADELTESAISGKDGKAEKKANHNGGDDYTDEDAVDLNRKKPARWRWWDLLPDFKRPERLKDRSPNGGE